MRIRMSNVENTFEIYLCHEFTLTLCFEQQLQYIRSTNYTLNWLLWMLSFTQVYYWFWDFFWVN